MLGVLSRFTQPAAAAAEMAVAAASVTAGRLTGEGPQSDLDYRDPEFIRRTLPALGGVWKSYFRAEARGLERIPADGPVLLIGNHSGGFMIPDTWLFTVSFYEHFGPERRFHQLAHDFVLKVPFLAFLRKYGTVTASHRNADRALESGAALLLYPGGDVESQRPSWESSTIDFAGRRGFIAQALKHDVPIVPIVSIGGQETALFLSRGERLARFTGLSKATRIKVLPIVAGPPWGLMVGDPPLARLPLPAKITIEALDPIDLRERFGPEPDHDDAFDHVVDTMQRALDALADERRLPVVG